MHINNNISLFNVKNKEIKKKDKKNNLSFKSSNFPGLIDNKVKCLSNLVCPVCGHKMLNKEGLIQIIKNGMNRTGDSLKFYLQNLSNEGWFHFPIIRNIIDNTTKIINVFELALPYKNDEHKPFFEVLEDNQDKKNINKIPLTDSQLNQLDNYDFNCSEIYYGFYKKNLFSMLEETEYVFYPEDLFFDLRDKQFNTILEQIKADNSINPSLKTAIIKSFYNVLVRNQEEKIINQKEDYSIEQREYKYSYHNEAKEAFNHDFNELKQLIKRSKSTSPSLAIASDFMEKDLIRKIDDPKRFLQYLQSKIDPNVNMNLVTDIHKKTKLSSDERKQYNEQYRDAAVYSALLASELLTIDHIYPKSKGGKEELCNLIPVCQECNRIKSNKIDVEYPYIMSFADSFNYAIQRNPSRNNLSDYLSILLERMKNSSYTSHWQKNLLQ